MSSLIALLPRANIELWAALASGMVCLLALVWSLHLGVLTLAGVAAVVAVLFYEHSLVKPTDLSRVNAAFFTMNGYVSVLFFLFWAVDILFFDPGL